MSGPEDEPRRLRAEVVRQYARGRYAEAAEAARALVAWQRTTVGDRHPDYARALASLALLLAKVGDAEEATQLMGVAASIRREVLGAAHPETIEAESHLSSLEASSGAAPVERGPATSPLRPRSQFTVAGGGMLSNGMPRAVEPTAAAPRRPVVPATPLLILAESGQDWAPIAADRRSGDAGPAGKHGPATGAATASTFAGSIGTLAERLGRLGTALSALGRLPTPEQLDELNACRSQLDTICRRAGRAIGRDESARPEASLADESRAPSPSAGASPLPAAMLNGRNGGERPTAPYLRPDRLRPIGPTTPGSVSPADSGLVPPPVRPAVGPVPPVPGHPGAAASRVGPRPAQPVATPHDDSARTQALALLDRVLHLTIFGSGDPGVLTGCLLAAESLRAAIQAVPTTAPRHTIDDLAQGRHAFASLLALVDRRDAMTDGLWASHHEAIVGAFGKPLALAVSRGRIRPQT
ncbi:MAG: tetratricopeptide repeat protein [Isosphaeraceae bacterium]